MENTEMTVLTVDQVISQELVKANVTEALIASLKERYMPLKIAGIEDKETYQLVKEGRKEAKRWRVAAEKICKAGREEANKISKAWVAKEKEVTDQISEVEGYLEKQEKEYEAAVAKDKEERRRKQDEQLIVRQQVLTKMGVLYADGKFSLGEVEFEMSLVKECEEDIWEESILPKFQTEYEKVEAERIEQDRIKKEKEAELKRQQEENERKEKELAEREAALKKAEEERICKEKKEQERKEAEAKELARKKYESRCKDLLSLGMTSTWPNDDFRYGDVIVHEGWIIESTDEVWLQILNEITPKIEGLKAEAEQKRLAEIEAQKEAERKMILGQSRLKALKELGRVPIDATAISLSDLSEEEYDTLYANEKREYEAAKRAMWEQEQEKKRILELGYSRLEIANKYNVYSYDKTLKAGVLGAYSDEEFEIIRDSWQAAYEKAEEEKKKQEMEQAKEKDKWADIINQINAIQIHEFKSGQYNAKVKLLKQKLEEIKSL